MNAPEQLNDAEFRLIPIELLVPSPTNPRKRFDATKLQELASSIKAQGILQPILVRAGTHLSNGSDEAPGTVSGYEIIAGERRYRAARIAGLTELPCTIRNLTDQQVLHAQVVENLQRDDLHPLEEAEGYERLMKEKDADGKPYTADSIAAEIGKSRSYVYARMKLLDLCKEGRDALYEGQIGAEVALLVARIPVHSLQIKALKALANEMPYGNSFMAQGDKMSFRKAKEYMQENFMLDLTRKVFDIADATLLPKAGACTDCPKRTGNSPELFDDVKSPDTCTDPTCFALKKTAAVKRLQEKAEADGAKFVSGNAAKKIIPSSYGEVSHQLENTGHALLTAKIPGDEKGRTWNQAIKQAGLLDARVANENEQKYTVQKIAVENPHEPGKVHTVINIEEATKALREAGFVITPKADAKAAGGRGRSDEDLAEEAALKAKVELENTYRAKLFETVHGKIAEAMSNPAHPVFEKISAMMCAAFMLEIEENGFNEDAMAAILGRYTELPDFKEVELYDWLTHFRTEIIPAKLNNTQHFLLMVDLLFRHDLVPILSWRDDTFDNPESLLVIAEACTIDPKAIKKEAAKEHKAKAAAEAKAEAEKTAEKKAPAKKPRLPGSVEWPFPTPELKGGAA